MYSSTVTQKGQVTFPLELRNKYGLKSYGRVKLVPGDDHIKIYAEEDILDIAGKHTAKKGQSALIARKIMEKEYVRV